MLDQTFHVVRQGLLSVLLVAREGQVHDWFSSMPEPVRSNV